MRKKSGKQLVVISIDGLQLQSYLSKEKENSYIRSLTRKGTFSTQVEPVYPSVTYTNHSTIVTGTYADRHGILANTQFNPNKVNEWVNGESIDWNFESKRIAVPTLWDEARKHGYNTATVKWPVTVGAQVDWLIPEIFPVPPIHENSVFDIMMENSTLELKDFFQMDEIKLLKAQDDIDAFTCLSSRYILDNHCPNLMLVHLTMYDHFVHKFGKFSVQADYELNRTDQFVRTLMELIQEDRTFVAILGDHGFSDFKKRIHINSLFVKKGWIQLEGAQIKDWQVIAHINCGQGAIYLKDVKMENQVLETLSGNSDGLYQILSKETLNRLRAFPHAICSVVANRGYSLGQGLNSNLVEEILNTRGEHGYLPGDPEMSTGFLVLGPGIAKGKNLGKMRLLDVGPTLAHLINIKLPEAEGQVIDLKNDCSR